MRLLRVNASDGECNYETVEDYKTMKCETGYSAYTEDTTQYVWGWEVMKSGENQPDGYRYYKPIELGEQDDYYGMYATYGSGGYTVDLDKGYDNALFVIQELEFAAWIDTYTRAVFTEFTVLDVQSRQVTVATLTAEIAPTGDLQTAVELITLTLYPACNHIGYYRTCYDVL